MRACPGSDRAQGRLQQQRGQERERDVQNTFT